MAVWDEADIDRRIRKFVRDRRDDPAYRNLLPDGIMIVASPTHADGRDAIQRHLEKQGMSAVAADAHIAKEQAKGDFLEIQAVVAESMAQRFEANPTAVTDPDAPAVLQFLRGPVPDRHLRVVMFVPPGTTYRYCRLDAPEN